MSRTFVSTLALNFVPSAQDRSITTCLVDFVRHESFAGRNVDFYMRGIID